MKLLLKRPLAFFDLETTGVNISVDRIVELSILKVSPDGTEDVLTMRVNPGIPIPPESSMFHGVYDEDVKDLPSFKRSEEHTSELQSRENLVCRLLLEKKKKRVMLTDSTT